ncbi:MAG: hypothetical protein MUP76_09765 [Acidimicrobiia bacterium]|nr:hypothetical protein [Acidimicrobiia bacterium]
MSGDADEWLDEHLLADDITSSPGWRRAARGGRTVNAAIAGIPRHGQLTTRVPIEQWRVVKKHVDSLGIPLGAYMRQAIGARMLSEGVPRADVETLMTMGQTNAGD